MRSIRSWLRHSRFSVANRTKNTRVWRGQPRFEVLEDRLAPAILTVNSLADTTNSGDVLTLRDAILVENGNLSITSLSSSEQGQITGTLHAPGGDTIRFDSGLAGKVI